MQINVVYTNGFDRTFTVQAWKVKSNERMLILYPRLKNKNNRIHIPFDNIEHWALIPNAEELPRQGKTNVRNTDGNFGATE